MTEHPLNSHCACGKTEFTIQGQALMRGFCHCTICQSFNQASFADITLFKASDIIKPLDEMVVFNSLKFPPILRRGKCVACGGAAIEYLKAPMLDIIIVPTSNIRDQALIPEPALHIFYDKRVADIHDDLPKYNGYLSSQLAFGKKLMASLFHGE